MPSNVISIIILVTITLAVTALMTFGYYLIIKTTRKLSSNGLLDDEFIEEKKHGKRWVSILLNVVTLTLSSVLLLLCGVGLVYRINNEQFIFHNKTSFVISSNSMESFYNEEYEKELVNNLMSYKGISEEEAKDFLEDTEFMTGDLLGFNTINNDDKIALFEVYGYKNKKGQIITHRLVAIEGENYIFRGDNTVANDIVVNRDQILYHYNNFRIAGVGIFVLFFSSSFGIYSIFVTVLLMVMSDVVKHRYDKIKRERLIFLGEHKHAYQ